MNSNGELIPLNRIPRHIHAPSPPHLSTVVRWICRGVGNPPVRLATVKIGGRRYTTQAAIDEFVAATSKSSVAETLDLTGCRRVAIQRAEHLLDADGLG